MTKSRELLARIIAQADINSAGSVALINDLLKSGAEQEQIEHDLGVYLRGHADALAKVANAVGVVPGTWTLSRLDPRDLPTLAIWEV